MTGHNITNFTKEFWADPRNKKRMVAKLTTAWQNPKRRALVSRKAKEQGRRESKMRSERAKRQWQDPIRKQGVVAKFRKMWKNPHFHERVIKAMCVARNRSPNFFEARFDSLTPDEIKYTGNGKLWVRLPNGKMKNPDFSAGGSRVIELHGDYWHRGENSDELVQLYKEAGYDCLVIWEHEMEDVQAVLKKVATFTRKDTWQMALSFANTK